MEETAVQRLYRAFNVVQKSSGISSIFLSLWSEEDSYQNGLVALAKMQILVPAPKIQELKHSENETFRGRPELAFQKCAEKHCALLWARGSHGKSEAVE